MKRMTADLVQDALTMAVWRRRPKPGLIHHTDRGSQYASVIYLKTERTNHRLYRTRDEAKQDVIDYIEMFYNNRRLHSYLGYLSPNEFESPKLRIAA